MFGRDEDILTTIFCDVDDFCKEFEPECEKILVENRDSESSGDKKTRNRKTELSLSEAITIVTMFHKTKYRTFKDYYHRYVIHLLKSCFPKLCICSGGIAGLAKNGRC